MMDKKLEQLKRKYEEIEIPDELDHVVKQALNKHKVKKRTASWTIGAAAALLLFTAGINTSPVMANTLSDVPVIGNIVKVMTFTAFQEETKNQSADIKVPAVSDLGNEELENSLNANYLEEGKALYKEFKEMEEGHYAIDSGYEVKTDNEQILVIERYVHRAAGSGSITIQYDTIDKNNHILLSLPMLFTDNSYMEVISSNIKEQMLQQMKEDPNKLYWVDGSGEEDFGWNFEVIDAKQQFYINDDGKLVLSFDEYEVAPGYMGAVEFVIPTEVINSILVSNQYIK